VGNIGLFEAGLERKTWPHEQETKPR
jgi:hypothetical protein